MSILEFLRRFGATNRVHSKSSQRRNRRRADVARQLGLKTLGLESLEARVPLAADLVKDINHVAGWIPWSLSTTNRFDSVAIGDMAYFVWSEEKTGVELWRSDGTVEGTVLVKDINPGKAGSSPRYLTNVAGTLYFRADDGVHGYELWKSDGTPEGTVLVKDIVRGPGTSFPHDLTAAGDTLFFSADDWQHGIELWKSDGTANGTAMVADLTPSRSTYLGELANLNGVVYFGHDGDLWRSDGTLHGTNVVKSDVGLRDAAAIGDKLLFTSGNSSDVIDLWSTDGTSSGTKFIRQLSGPVTNLVNHNGTLFFQADNELYGRELWKSDGTRQGTVIVKDISPGKNHSDPNGLLSLGSYLFFTAKDGNDRDIWRTNGTVEGTSRVTDLGLTVIVGAAGDHLIAWNYRRPPYQGPNNLETLAIDSQTGAITLLREQYAGATDDGVAFPQTISASNQVFLIESNREGISLWRFDETIEGAVKLAESEVGTDNPYLNRFIDVDGTLFFTAISGPTGKPVGLWSSDGTSNGTRLLRHFDLFVSDMSAPNNLTNVGGTLFFTASGGLWKSDGTESGTVIVKDKLSFANTSFVAAGNTLFFVGANEYGQYNAALWRSDGTSGGTQLVKDFIPHGPARPFHLTAVGETVYFFATMTEGGLGLWHSDGTEAGTVLVKKVSDQSATIKPLFLVNADGLLYFTMDSGDGTHVLWRSDGTAEGTDPLRTLTIGWDPIENRFSYVPIGRSLFFAANDGVHGVELWKSDGTLEGTVMVKELIPGPGSNWVRALTNVDGQLFFFAFDRNGIPTVWKSDGTAEGTVAIHHYTRGHTGRPDHLTAHNGMLYFASRSDGWGSRLIMSDGTDAGTLPVEDEFMFETLYPGDLISVGENLFFTADVFAFGKELWVLRADQDHDGVEDRIENLAPNGGDGNQDGIPDATQSHVASIQTHGGDDFLTLVAAEGHFRNVVAREKPWADPAPVGIEFPFGAFEFAVLPGSQSENADVTVLIHSGSGVNTFYAFTSTRDNEYRHWYRVAPDSGGVGNGRAELQLADGGSGDEDLCTNGAIQFFGAMGRDTRSATRQNAINAADVNDDGLITPFDALLIVNEINRAGLGEFDPSATVLDAFPFYDTSGDNVLSPIDVLIVVNRLNGRTSQVAGSPAEGESSGFIDTLIRGWNSTTRPTSDRRQVSTQDESAVEANTHDAMGIESSEVASVNADSTPLMKRPISPAPSDDLWMPDIDWLANELVESMVLH